MDVEKINEASERLAELLNKLEKGGSLPKEKKRVIDDAADGFRFWRRVHLENLNKVFNNGSQ